MSPFVMYLAYCVGAVFGSYIGGWVLATKIRDHDWLVFAAFLLLLILLILPVVAMAPASWMATSEFGYAWSGPEEKAFEAIRCAAAIAAAIVGAWRNVIQHRKQMAPAG